MYKGTFRLGQSTFRIAITNLIETFIYLLSYNTANISAVMKLINVPAITFFAVISPLAHAECFGSGSKAETLSAKVAIQSFCAQGQMGGLYAPNQFITRCKNSALNSIVSRVRWDFRIYNLRNSDNFMNSDGCQEFFLREIGCEYGGDRSYPELGWRFV